MEWEWGWSSKNCFSGGGERNFWHSWCSFVLLQNSSKKWTVSRTTGGGIRTVPYHQGVKMIWRSEKDVKLLSAVPLVRRSICNHMLVRTEFPPHFAKLSAPRLYIALLLVSIGSWQTNRSLVVRRSMDSYSSMAGTEKLFVWGVMNEIDKTRKVRQFLTRTMKRHVCKHVWRSWERPLINKLLPHCSLTYSSPSSCVAAENLGHDFKTRTFRNHTDKMTRTEPDPETRHEYRHFHPLQRYRGLKWK